MEREITTKHLQGISDLTLVAPIKQGLISTLDTRTYASRLRAVLKTLNTLRKASREQSLVRPFSDSTDRIRTITDLRMAIHEPEQKLLLSVTFDRPWEPYLRIIWRDVGTLLDVIFCNCDTYLTSFDHSFAEYGDWIRKARTNTQFFYKASALSFDDVQYLRQTELLHRAVPPPVKPDLEAAKLVVTDPEQVAIDTAGKYRAETARLGMQALSVLYRLADFYQGDPDDGILLRASRQLLRELTRISPVLPPPVRERFEAQLKWFERIPPAAAPAPAPPSPPNTDDVQGGILKPYERVTHGCVLLISVPDPATAAAFLPALTALVTTEGGGKPGDGIYVNVAFTAEGLRKLGLSEADMAGFPHEFCEGMQQRAGLIGDVRGNHPGNWALPELGWPERVVDRATGNAALVQLSTVHIVVQLRMQSDDVGHELIVELRDKVKGLMDLHPKVQLLSVQPMRSYPDKVLKKPREHFGFIDGLSQPVVGPRPPGNDWSNFIGQGELLLGYKNDRGDNPARNALCDNGSFLVIRKLRQDVAALNAAIKASGIAPDALKAKMMGRTVDGDSLVPPTSSNAFHYRDDKDGGLCPFAAHIRRANPRTGDSNVDGTPTVPRIMRRGMSYGPRYNDKNEDDPVNKQERGLVFMAYNASIAEQFEVIQRWISGGNSTGVLSEHGDPLLGVPQLGETRSFRYHDGASVTRVKLDDANDKPSRPFVRLEWGIYLFAPSKTALGKLEEIARASGRPTGPDPSVVEQGEKIIANLHVSDHWKAAFEDSHARSSGESEAVWAAIRDEHNGVLRTPYGVLVASHVLVMQVLNNGSEEYSVSDYVPRLRDSIGEIYLGLDDAGEDSDYRKQATLTNKAIQAIGENAAFDLARAKAKEVLGKLIVVAKLMAQMAGESTWEVTLDIKELSDKTLALLCEEWFSLPGIKGKERFKAGGWRWDWKSGDLPLYPGNFTAPSRFLFQPDPGPAAERYGKEHGKALKDSMNLFVSDYRASGSPPSGALARRIFEAFPNPADTDVLARTLTGVLMGFLPTVDGNLRATLNEWLGGGTLRLTLNERLDTWTFWDLQNAYLMDAGVNSYAKASNVLLKPLMRTMQLRPVPELLWRTAIKPHKLGDIDVVQDDKIVVGSVSATQEDLAADKTGADDKPDVYPVFGGNRRADPHPTHACPGYEIAMGVLLGMISALMEMGPVRPTPAPLTLSLRGTMP